MKNKNKTSSNFNIYKNPNLSDYNSIDTPNKKEELFKSDINSINSKKTIFENSFQFEQNFLSRINYKKNTVVEKYFRLNLAIKKFILKLSIG